MTDTLTETKPAPAHGVALTAAAADKVRSLYEQEGRDDLALRGIAPQWGMPRRAFVANGRLLAAVTNRRWDYIPNGGHQLRRVGSPP